MVVEGGEGELVDGVFGGPQPLGAQREGTDRGALQPEADEKVAGGGGQGWGVGGVGGGSDPKPQARPRLLVTSSILTRAPAAPRLHRGHPLDCRTTITGTPRRPGGGNVPYQLSRGWP
ncbi:hypothetical protein SGL43_07086 [Streptomyces globisporus]|uniref:Uncharacterized protein n=1 Tax=Streptomyces globisporus TaxID=1908 RepID=A0ABM9H8S6_STRGL|nr:hypothetical protein SGL43_07086 [Streptomyces globisporus]